MKALKNVNRRRQKRRKNMPKMAFSIKAVLCLTRNRNNRQQKRNT